MKTTKITKKEIKNNVRTYKTLNGWSHEYITGDDTLWYCHINRFDPSQIVYAQSETGEAHNLADNTKSAFVDFLYDLENED